MKEIMADRSELNIPLEFHLVDHCNLNCRHCAHYSPVARPRFATMDEVAEACHVASIIQPKRFHILGGEPLLHPGIDEIMAYIGENVPADIRKVIITNGIRLSEMSDEFWRSIREYRFVLYMTVYPIKVAYGDLISLAETKGKVRPAGIRYPVICFTHIRLAEDRRYDPGRAYSACRAKCIQIRDGKLYPCPYSAYIEHINRRYRTSFSYEDGDFLKIEEIMDGKVVDQWMEEPKPFCSYCNYGSESLVRWENAATHDMAEWVETD